MKKYLPQILSLALIFTINISYTQELGTDDVDVENPDLLYEVDDDLVKLFADHDVNVAPALVAAPDKLPCDGKWVKKKKEVEVEVPGATSTTNAKKIIQKILDLIKGTKALDDYAKSLFECEECLPLFKGCEKEVKNVTTKIIGSGARGGKYYVKIRITFEARCTICVPDVNIAVLVKSDSRTIPAANGIFPNPAFDQVRIKIDFKNEIESLQIMISDITGKTYLDRSFDVSGLIDFERSFNIDDYKPGIYIVTSIFDGEYVDSQKLIIK